MTCSCSLAGTKACYNCRNYIDNFGNYWITPTRDINHKILEINIEVKKNENNNNM